MAKSLLLTGLSFVGSALACIHARDAPPSFGYHGLTGPLNWYSLDKTANEKCAFGRNQSPINFRSASCTSSSGITLDLLDRPHGAPFENLGTTVEVTTNGTLTHSNKTYALRQFHFHTPSEHHIDDEYAPLEVHFVFQAAGMPYTFPIVC